MSSLPAGRDRRLRVPAPPADLLGDIVEAVLDGQPKDLRLAEILGNGPVGWDEQRSHWLRPPAA